MKFSRIFRQATLFWPAQIDISDGELRDGSGGYFPQLSRIWNSAESHTDGWSEWHKLMTWAIFCAFHKAAVANFRANKSIVTKKELEMSYIVARFEESLFAPNPSYPSWMRKSYRSIQK